MRSWAGPIFFLRISAVCPLCHGWVDHIGFYSDSAAGVPANSQKEPKKGGPIAHHSPKGKREFPAFDTTGFSNFLHSTQLVSLILGDRTVFLCDSQLFFWGSLIFQSKFVDWVLPHLGTIIMWVQPLLYVDALPNSSPFASRCPLQP